MHVFILALGTRGDVELFLTLGRALRRRGHHVLFGASPFYGGAVEVAGLEFEPVGTGTRAELLEILASLKGISDRTLRVGEYFQRWVRPQFLTARGRIQALAAASDYFLSNLKTALRRQGEVIPGAFVTYDPPDSVEDLQGFGTGIPAGRVLELVAMPQALLDPEGRWGGPFHFTGFWSEATPAWEPPPGLSAFLDTGPPPAVLTMGSMVTFDAPALARTFAEALRQAGQRGVIVGGWSNLGPGTDGPVFQVDEVPYDWLFPRAACVLHHGGCGTVGAVLRAGRPSILLPQIYPQQRFGTILTRAGIAAGTFDANHLNASDLATAIRRTAADAGLAERARHWQAVTTRDGGAELAADLIEDHWRRLTTPNDTPACTPPVPPAERASKPRVLFVVSNDFGELSTAVFFALGQPFDALLLLPPKLAHMGAALPVPARPYHTAADVLAAVERDRPDLVALCSGYLFFPGGIFTLDELGHLLRALAERGCRLLTSDPFVGVLADVSEYTFQADPEECRQLAACFRATHDLLRHTTHLYWGNPPAGATATGAVGFSLSHLVRPPAYVPCRREYLDEIGADPARRRWLFVLAGDDYWVQAAARGGPVFDDWLAARLREAARQGRQPVLLAPSACTSAVTLRTPDINGLVLLNECRHDLFFSLLLEAEQVFSWNVVSNSALVRAVNRLPVFYHDPGHLARYCPPLYHSVVRSYFGGVGPDYLPVDYPLDAAALANRAGEVEGMIERMARAVLASPSPGEVVGTLLGWSRKAR